MGLGFTLGLGFFLVLEGILLLWPSIFSYSKYLTKFANNFYQRGKKSSHFLEIDYLYRKNLSIFTMCAATICFEPHPNLRYEIQVIIIVYLPSFHFYAGINYVTGSHCTQFQQWFFLTHLCKWLNVKCILDWN